MNLPAFLRDAVDDSVIYVETGDLPGSERERPSLVLRHAGGALAEVDVLEAGDAGLLHVRWRGSVGAAPYVLHVFKNFPPEKKTKKDDAPLAPIAGRVELPAARSGHLWKGKSAKRPLPWTAFDLEGARRLWRRMRDSKT